MSHRTLIAYASRAGSTAEVAETVGDVLRESGIEVDVRSVKDVTDVAGYDSAILGSAIWAGKPLPEVRKLVKDQHDDLVRLPVAYFILCDTLREDTPANRRTATGYVAPFRELKEPVSEGLFAGRRDFSAVHPLLTWVLKHVFRLVEGDFRDWNQIRAWAATVARQLTGGEPAHLATGAA
jgi:menaquinone-dependent protoporphyrinogen oxidase